MLGRKTTGWGEDENWMLVVSGVGWGNGDTEIGRDFMNGGEVV